MNEDLMERPEQCKNSKGGTELIQERIYNRLPRELLEKFQIWFSRYNPEKVNRDKIQILYVHDWVGDPMYDHLKNDGWKKFNRILFVSNVQMLHFMGVYSIPWSFCLVMQNFIDPIEPDKSIEGTMDPKQINIGYWAVPRKGLQIVVPVYEKLIEKYDNILLHVTSSFGLYGWAEQDEQYANIIDKCKNHPNISYSEAINNETMRACIATYDILAYPSIFPETSCLCLMEAMSAGCICVHPNYAALFETAAGWTNMYQWHEDQSKHAGIFYNAMCATIDSLDNDEVKNRLIAQKTYADTFYTWSKREAEWLALLSVLSKNRANLIVKNDKEYFSYMP
jgi:glycosyltransferase involved in cell wall biosynthesis